MLSGLEPARDVVWAVHFWGVPASVGAAALATALLGLLYLPSRARALAVPGTALLAVGLLGAAGWYAQREMVPERVHEAILDADSEAPEWERLIAADVVRSLVYDGSFSTWPPAAAVLLVGGTLIGIAFTCRTGPNPTAQEVECRETVEDGA